MTGSGARGPDDLREAGEALRGGAYHWREYGIRELLPRAGETGPRLLLLGCGDAGEVPFLEALGFAPVGLDIRPSAGTDVLGDAHTLPFGDGVFDVVLSMQVLEHLRAPWIAAREIARILRPGGRFVGSVAFLKPYHGSYFHMSHKGVEALLDDVGLHTDHFHGAQSLTYTLYGWTLGFAGVRVRRALLGAVDRFLLGVRSLAWKLTRKADPAEPDGRWDDRLMFSFRGFDRLRFAPAVVFRARKPEAGRTAERQMAEHYRTREEAEEEASGGPWCEPPPVRETEEGIPKG